MASERHQDCTLVVRCAWCDRVRVAPDEWVEQNDEVEAHAFLGRASHGICPDCLARVKPTRG